MEDRDFIDFEFNGHWASEFNLLAVSNSDRYSNSFYGTVNANTADMVGKYGIYKWKTQIGEKRFSINIAYDNVDLNTLRKIKEWLNPFVIGKLVFKEEPYKYYWVSLAEDPEISFLPFLTEETVVDGRRLKKGVYKGEFVINFVCFDNYGYSDWNSFDENYDYIVKELEISDDEVNFDDGSDNSLIISQIDGNLKQNKESQAYYITSQESNRLTLNNITNTDTEKWSIKGGNSQVVQNYNSIRVEGENFDLNDVDNSKTMDIQLKGNHFQEIREGYNIVDLTSFPRGERNGITSSIDLDKGSITLNGTCTETFAYGMLLALNAGTVVSYSLNNLQTNSQVAMRWGLEDSTQEGQISCEQKNSKMESFALTKNTVSWQLRIGVGTVLKDFVIYPQIEVGSILHKFETYGATPSLKFPSEIKTVKDNVNVVVCNKNLFDKNNATVVEFFVDGENKIQSWTDEVESIYISIKPNTTYTVSKKISSRFTVATSNKVPVVGVEVNAVSNRTASNLTITSRNGDKYLLIFYYKKSDDTLNAKEIRDSIQIEKGSTATDFVEHQEQTMTIPVQQEMLQEDYFDFKNEKQTNLFEKIIVDGDKIRANSTRDTSDGNFQWSFSITTKADKFRKIYSNVATQATNFGEINGVVLSNNSKNVYIKNNKDIFGDKEISISNLNEILKKMYDTGNPVIFYIEKVSDTELNFTDEQKAIAKQFKAITPYKDITHIYSTDEIKPKMVVDYNITREMPSLDYPSEIKTVSGKVENRVSNKQLYDVKDGGNASYLKENDYITLQADNTLGTSTSFINYFTKPSKIIKSNAYYYLIMEIKEVSGTGSIYPVSYYPSYNSQFQWFDEIRLENLKAGDVKVYKIQSLGDLTTSRTMLRTYAKFSKGESGSIKFRLSVFEKEPNIDKFVYTPFEKQSFIMPIQQDMLEGDYFDFDREKEVHNWAKLIFDGTENWLQSGNVYPTFYISPNEIASKFGLPTDLKALCNYFTQKSNIWGIDEIGFDTANLRQDHVDFRFCLGSSSTITTLEAWKNKLVEMYNSGNPLVLYFQIFTQDELDFTNEQKIVARQLKRSNFYKGTTNVILDNDLAKVKVNYDGYDGAPSEKHPSSVDGVKNKIDITVKNKNILSIPNSSNTSNGLTITYMNGTYKITGTPTINWAILTPEITHFITKGKYVLSYEVEGERYQLEPTFIYKNGETEKKWVQPSIKKQTIDLKDDVESLILGLSGFTINQAVNITLKIQLERGEEATEIVVPEQQKVSLPVQEEMYIGDYIDETGEHHKMAKIVIDGTNTRVSMTKKPLNDFIQTYLSTSEQFDPQVDINCYSNIMNQEYNARFGFINTFIKSKTGIYFHFKGDLLGDADCNDIGMNNWFKEQYNKGTPAYIIGPLKKEKVLPLTDEQKSALNILKNYTYSYPGANTISISGDTKPKITASYIPQQDINIDFILEGSNLLNDSAFYYNNDIYLKAFDEIDSGNPSTSGISSEREVYLYNAGNADASLKLTFDLIIPAENSPLTIVTSKGHFTKNGFEEINSYSQFSISNFAHYKPFVDIFDGVLSNWVIEIDSDLCEVYLKHKTNKDKVISLNRFNDNQSFLKLAGSDFVDYSKSFPTSLEEIKDSAIENTIFNKISLKESAQNYRLKNVSLDWKHTYL